MPLHPRVLAECAKAGAAAAIGLAAHSAACHLALLYAHQAAAAASTHAEAGHAIAGHVARHLPPGHQPGTHPMKADIDELLAAGGTVAGLTFINLYDHIIDEAWKKALSRARGLSVKDQQERLQAAFLHAKIALRDIKRLTPAELLHLEQLRAWLAERLRPMPPHGSAAPA
jgi:hypothetical protein